MIGDDFKAMEDLMTAPDKPKQDALDGPNFAAIYHPWYQGHAKRANEDRKGEDESSLSDLIAVRDGREPLPPGATCIIDLEPMPHGCEQLYWPTWHFKFVREDGSVAGEGDLSNENHEVPGFVHIQAPERPDGVWIRSSGYRLICHFEPQPFKHSLEISGEVGGIKSRVTVVPWVSQR